MGRLEYTFGRFRLLPDRQLLDGGVPVRLGRKALGLLSVLARADGELVTKDELMAAVWPNVIVEDNAIQVHIAALRKALGQESSRLSTVHGLGYRLAAARAADAPRTNDLTPAPSGPTDPLLAVLAFDNLCEGGDMTWFTDGVSEEIQQTVARAADLRVIGRASSFQFRGADKAADRVAVVLKATHVLDGSVRRSGNKVRISAQLIECAAQTTLWSAHFDRDLADIFALQDEIAAAVAVALKARFVPPKQLGPIDPIAYDLYLKARRGPSNEHLSHSQQIGLLERAVSLAPEFATAWAELSWVRAIVHRGLSVDEHSIPVSRSAVVSAAETALRLDPNSGSASAALATLLPRGDFGGRETLLRRALAAAPRSTRLLVDTGWFLTSVGRNEEALDIALRALALDPLDGGAANLQAQMLCAAGRYEEGQRSFAVARERWPLAPLFIFAPLFLAALRHDWPRFEHLRLEAERLGLSGTHTRDALAVGRLLREPTPERRARYLDLASAQLANSGTVGLGRLVVACDLGMDEEVSSLIERASFAHLNEESGPPPDSDVAPGLIFDLTPRRTMMQDIRFVGLCAKFGLCDYWARTEQWPDCVQLVDYDFKAECLRLAKA
jgi:adenylate cyclase